MPDFGKLFEEDLAKRDREADMMALAKAFYKNIQRNQYCEYGGIGLDDKRPFGDSGVEWSILEIIGWEHSDSDSYRDMQYTYAEALYDDLPEFLQVRWADYLKLNAMEKSKDPVRTALDNIMGTIEALEDVHGIVQSLEDEKNMAQAKIERMQKGLQDIIDR